MQDEQKLKQDIRTALNASVDRLDPEISRHLQQARQAALAKIEKPRRPFWQPAGAFALASVLLLAVFILPDRNTTPEVTALADLDVIASDNLPLYEELEFYQWLLENDVNAG